MATATGIPSRPSPPALVNDLADVLSPEEESMLETKLEHYNDTTSTQIAVVTVSDIGDNDIADYAYTIGVKWGVGQKDLDNGIVVLVAVDDHKMFIATGYGIEGYITDARASRIYREIMAPQFQQKNYYTGLDLATTQIIEYLNGAFDEEGDAYGSPEDGGNVWITLIIIIIILILISRFFRGGGGTTFTRGGPIFWGGGFGGFGRGGGGGFGGFGGGGFGGGGAGGSW